MFLNYRIARDKYQPDYFLYENNKSMSPAIRAQITAELGVEPVLINSALVSAQNRQRLYWVGKRNPDGTYSQVDVKQPADCGILLRDILESTSSEKAYLLKQLTEREMGYMVGDHEGYSDRWTYLQKPGEEDKSCCITANVHRGVPYNVLAVPVQVGAMPGKDGELGTSQSRRIYSTEGKSVSLQARPNGGGADGAATGLYALQCCMRYERSPEAKRMRKQYEAHEISHGYHEFSELHPRADGKSNTLSTVLKDNPICEQVFGTESGGSYAISAADGKEYPVYEVRGGRITIKGKTYPIKLADGFYIIRKLTVTECKRLQTVLDAYEFPVSNTQAYKMLGNGWTVDVIAHIMRHFEGLTAEPVEVLSMYDGMSCGHIALDKLGAAVSVYYATEIDKYAIQTTQHNFPDTVQLGDAFQVRDEGWRLPEVLA